MAEPSFQAVVWGTADAPFTHSFLLLGTKMPAGSGATSTANRNFHSIVGNH